MSFEDFHLEFSGDVAIEQVNLTRATYKEAQAFRERLEHLITSEHLNIIVDLGKCEYVDSTFVGAMVVAHKKIVEFNGKMVIRVTKSTLFDFFATVGLNKVFEIFETRDDAINSFKK